MITEEIHIMGMEDAVGNAAIALVVDVSDMVYVGGLKAPGGDLLEYVGKFHGLEGWCKDNGVKFRNFRRRLKLTLGVNSDVELK